MRFTSGEKTQHRAFILAELIAHPGRRHASFSRESARRRSCTEGRRRGCREAENDAEPR
jgi:hypothetical protein